MKFAPILQITRYTIIFCVKRMLKYIGFFPLYAALWTIINSENIEFAMVMPDTIKLKTKNQMTTNHVVKCELGVRELGKFKIKNCVCTSVHAQSCLTLCYPWTAAHQAPLSVEYSVKNTTVGCHFLLQISPTQGSNSGLLHWQVDSLPLNPQGSAI